MVRVLWKHVLVVGWILFFTSQVFSAFEYKLISAYSAGCGGVQSLDEPEALCVFYMPCALAFLDRINIQTFHTRIFNMKELTENAIALAVPMFGRSCLSVGYSVFGDRSLYEEQEISLGYSIRIRKISSLSMSVRFMRLMIGEEDYINESKYIPGIDLSCRFVKKPVIFSFLIKNINSAQIGKNYKETLGRGLVFGLNYIINSRTNLYLESLKEIPYELSFRYGLDYKISNGVKLLFGMQARPPFIGAGFCFSLLGFRLDYSIRSHQYLAVQHLSSFSLYF